jgi:hypothetical protein
MPYEKWILADTGWLVLLLGLVAYGMRPVDAGSQEGFVCGLFAASAGFGWWRHREARKADWWSAHNLQQELNGATSED